MKKQENKPVEIDFDKVLEEVKQPEEVRLHNIFNELGYTPSEAKSKPAPPNDHSHEYYKYKQWLRSQGIDEWVFKC